MSVCLSRLFAITRRIEVAVARSVDNIAFVGRWSSLVLPASQTWGFAIVAVGQPSPGIVGIKDWVESLVASDTSTRRARSRTESP